MKVIGFDPGLTRAGVAVVEQQGSRLVPLVYGTLRSEGADPPAQLASLRRRLLSLIQEHEPRHMAVERVFFNRNVLTAARTLQAAGVAQALASECGLGVFEYGPLEVKNALVGVGNADKSQVQFMVRRVLGLTEDVKEPDAADALALAICALHSRPWMHNAAVTGR